MERKEYLSIRLKKDFLKYSLLQDDSLSAKEIAHQLFKTIYIGDFIKQGKSAIAELLVKYLYFDKLKVNGKLSNELPQELEFGVQEKIVGEFQVFLDGLYTCEIRKSLIDDLLHRIEKQAWRNGVLQMETAVSLLVNQLNKAAQDCSYIYGETFDEEELKAKYDEAKENTLLERIQGNNIDDIIEYRNALTAYVTVKCENLLYDTIRNIYQELAQDEAFQQLQTNFKSLLEYATQLQNSLPELEAHAEWDKEYNHLIPTDFYLRNVEGITAEHAFHMVLFQLFAKNEEWMVEQGMLVNGELKVFVGCNVFAIEELLRKLEI